MKVFLLLPILLLCACLSYAQENLHKTIFKVNATTLVNELDLYMEQQLNDHYSLEIGAGGIYTDYWDYLLNQVDFGQIKPNISRYQYTRGHGFNARLGLRYYVIPTSSANSKISSRGIYFEPLLFFKRVWYPDNKTVIENQDYWEHASKRIWGLQLLVGREHRLGKFIFDQYFGLGVRAKNYRFNDISSGGTSGAKNNDFNTTNWLPSLHLGLKIGL